MEMLFTEGNPQTKAAFSSAVIVPATKMLYLSGQVGRYEDGTIPSSAAEQCSQVWRNVLAILNEQNLGYQDIVRITAYVTAAEHLPHYQASRRAALQGHLPASTSLIVSGLVSPALFVELDIIAAYPR